MRKKQIWIKTADAIEYYGTPAKLAAVLDVTVSAISQWGDYLPDQRAWQIQKMTADKLPVCYEEPEAA